MPQGRRLVLLVVGLAATTGIVIVDHLLPREVSVTVFYVAPVVFTAWHGGTALGVVMAAFAAVGWTEADTAARTYTNPGFAMWNAGAHLLFFAGAAAALGALREALDEARRTARTDTLTGVANRFCFREAASASLAGPGPLTVVSLDVDGFKAVNDLRGHAAGDMLLRRIAHTLGEVVREDDLVARLGGDEFAILLTRTDGDAAASLLRRIRTSLDRVMTLEGWPVTFSVGAITTSGSGIDVDGLMNRADEEMYRAKRGGKDQVIHQVVAAR